MSTKTLQALQNSPYKCPRTDFITFFLNYIHEEIATAISDRKPDPEDTKSSSEINRSLSYPLDLSSECDDSITNSTPKIAKVNSDSSVLSYMSPISPIYKTQSFSTPKAMCLGDFIVKKSSRKKSDTKKRIKPTNLTQHKINSFHKSENSFNFSKNETDEFPSERNSLLEERFKIFTRSDIQFTNGSPKKIVKEVGGEILPEVSLVTYRTELNRMVQVYSIFLDNNYVLNLTSEIYFLISLLLKRQFYYPDWGIDILSDKITNSIFKSIHNVVYFASKSLEKQDRILRNFDNSTIRLLNENSRLKEFAPNLVESLEKVWKPDRIIAIEPLQNNICFNSDTDNRQNFPNDLSFHAFKKQRDLFYDILRIWEQHHLAPGFSYIISLGGKIKTLLSLSNEPTNFIHFSRLFKAQLLNACRNSDCDDFITSLDVDAQKLNKLKSRCVTKETCQGLNSLPRFNEGEEFYRDFILVGANYCFNRHLSDAFIEEITELNESYFSNNEVDEGEGKLGGRYICFYLFFVSGR